MDLPRRLSVQIAIALAVLGGGASYVDRTYFPVPGTAGAVLRWAYPAFLLAGIAVFAVVYRMTFRPARAALRARAGGWEDSAAEGRAARMAIDAPARLAALGFGLTVCVTVISVLLRAHFGVEADLVLARAATGFSAAMAVALIVYSAAAVTAGRHLEELGTSDVRPGGSVQSKLLVLGLGLSACTVLLISALSYAGFRADSDRDYVDNAGTLVQEAATTVGAGWPTAACDLIQGALGAPTGVYSVAGELRARSRAPGDLPPTIRVDPARPAARSGSRAAGGCGAPPAPPRTWRCCRTRRSARGARRSRGR